MSLSLEARPDNAVLARRAVAGEAARARLDQRTVAAAKVVVTEGFSNAVQHAYRGGDGRVQVQAHADEDGITIVVRDAGDGFRPRPRPQGSIGGIGLLLVASLAELLQLRRLPRGGTELRARIGVEPAGAGRASP